MTPGITGGHIQISAAAGVGLRAGDSVVLTVLKRLDTGKWAVGIAGRVFPALSDLDLSPGATLRARVGTHGGRVVLTVQKGLENPASAALVRQGLPDNPMTQLIAGSLLRSGRPILMETVERIRSILSRSGLEPRRAARLAATLADKGIDLASPGLDPLMALLSLGEKGGGDPRRYRGRPFPGSAAELRRLVSGVDEDDGGKPAGLQVFNHARGSSSSWVIVPFVFTQEQESVAGTMKFLYDEHAGRLLRFVLSAEGVHFSLALEGGARRMTVFCDGETGGRAVRRGLDTLRAKFHNMGMEVDDTVNDGELFDGFSPSWEGATLRSIDAVG
jgi:hypothetical protein